MARISVIILNWNGSKLLQTFLPQVIANTTHPDAEIVVADNASTDCSLELLRNEFPQVRLLIFDQNYGFAGGYNKALAQTDSEYTVLLNSDAAPAAGWLSPIIALLDANPNVAAVSPKLLSYSQPELFEYAGAAGGFIDWLCYPFCRGRILDHLETDNGQYNTDISVFWATGAALTVRTKIYNQVGGLDEDFFAHMEEIDLCWRLKNRGFDIMTCGHSTVFHLGGGTLSQQNPRKTYLNFRNNLTMLVKNYNSSLWPLVLLTRLVLDAAAGLHFIAIGKSADCAAIVRAHWNFFATLRSAIVKRNRLKPFRTNTFHPEMKLYSIMWRLFVRKQTIYNEK